MSTAQHGNLTGTSTLFVLAGGRGRRLATLTGSMPKCLWGEGFEPTLSRVTRFAEKSGLFDSVSIVVPTSHIDTFESWASGFQLDIQVIAKCSSRPRGVDDVLWACGSLPPGAVTIAHADTWFESDPFVRWREPHFDLELAGGTEIVPHGAMSAAISLTEEALITYEKNCESVSPYLQQPDRWTGMWRVSARLRHSFPQRFDEPLVESLVEVLSRRVKRRVVPIGRFINLNTPDHVRALREEI